MKIREEMALSFDDVLLVPRHYPGKSRKDVDLTTHVAGLKLRLPIISANMPGVTGFAMAKVMAEMGGLGIIDRIVDHDFVDFSNWKDENPTLLIGASIGIDINCIGRAQRLIQCGVDLICIDVAHADQKQTYDVVQNFRKKFPSFPLMIGNIAQPEMIENLRAPNTAFKVGIGGGSVCTTRIQTGCGMPTLQSVLDCRLPNKAFIHIVADGGIKNSGDIVKSLAAGADAVMIGSLLAGTDEAPGQLINANGKTYKVYRGSASAGAKAGAGLTSEFIEGAETLVPAKGNAMKVLKSLEDGIRSGMSYCGSMSLQELKLYSEFVRITPAGFRESQPHGAL